MAAATTDRDPKRSNGLLSSLLVGATALIYLGTMVGVNASGYAEPMDDDSALTFAGVARQKVDNSSGANGALSVEVDQEGIFSFAGTGFTQADVGKPVYALTDQDVGLAASATNDRFVGTIVEVTSATVVRVKILVQNIPDASDLSSVLADVATLQADMTTAQGDITTAQGDITTAQGDITTLQGQVAALGAENTDVEFDIPLLGGAADGGTWTPSIVSGLTSIARTAGTATQSYWVPVPIPNRTAAGKGIKPTGLRVNYTVDTGTPDDVRCELWKVTEGPDNSSPSAVVLFGDADGDYDASHDTAGKRGDATGAPEEHLAVVTDGGTPAYLAAGETLLFRFFVDGDAGGAAAVSIRSARLQAAETLVDLA